jgi:hypothetical protein
MDFSISKDPQSLKRTKLSPITQSALASCHQLQQSFSALKDAFEVCKTNKDWEGYQKVLTETEFVAKSEFANLKSCSTKATAVDQSFGKQLLELETLFSTRLNQTRDVQKSVITFLKDAKAYGPKEEAKKQLTKKVEQYDVELVEMNKKIEKKVQALE